MYQFNENIEAKKHDEFVSKHPLHNLLQSSSWAKVKDNWDSKIVGIYDKDTLVASALVLIKKLPLNFTMMYIPRGPIMDYENERLVKFFFQEMKKWAKRYKCLFIKIDPCILKNKYRVDEKVEDVLPEAQNQLAILKHVGCIHNGFSLSLEDTIQPRFNAMSHYDEDFENTLPKHTKRHIKTARKKHIEVYKYDSSMIDAFTDIMKLTEKRKNIHLRGKDYFKKILDTYQDESGLFLAQIDLDMLIKDAEEKVEKATADMNKYEKDNKKYELAQTNLTAGKSELEQLLLHQKECGSKPYVAACLAVIFGDTCEMLYMGMDDRFKKYMAPYLSHLTPMLWAFSKNCEKANMGGVEGTLQDGLTKFKSNFNPYIYEYVGEFDLPVNKVLYSASEWAYKIRKKKNLKK